MKKYIIALGALGTTVTPLVSVISCHKSDKNEATTVDIDKGITDVIVSDSKKTVLLTEKIGNFLKGEIKEKFLDGYEGQGWLNKARAISNNVAELKTNFINEIMPNLSLSFDSNYEIEIELKSFATDKVIRKILQNNLIFTPETPKKDFNWKGIYGIIWSKNAQSILKNQEFKSIETNKHFWNNLDKLANAKGALGLAVGLLKFLDPEKKVSDIIQGLLNKKMLSSDISNKLKKFNDLDIKVGDVQKIVKGLVAMVQNINYDLTTILKSNNLLNDALELLNKPHIIINKEKFNAGLEMIMSALGSLIYRNAKDINQLKTLFDKIFNTLDSKTLNEWWLKIKIALPDIMKLLGVKKDKTSNFITIKGILKRLIEITSSKENAVKFLESLDVGVILKIAKTMLPKQRDILDKLGFSGKIFSARFWYTSTGIIAGLAFVLPALKDPELKIPKEIFNKVSAAIQVFIDKKVYFAKKNGFITTDFSQKTFSEIKDLFIKGPGVWLDPQDSGYANEIKGKTKPEITEIKKKYSKIYIDKITADKADFFYVNHPEIMTKFLDLINKDMHEELGKWIDKIIDPNKDVKFVEGKDIFYTIIKRIGFEKTVFNLFKNKKYRGLIKMVIKIMPILCKNIMKKN